MKNKKETFYTFLFKDDNSLSLWIKNYIQLLEVLVKSLNLFSTRKIIIFTNIDISFNYPNMEVIRFEMEKDLPLPNRIIQPNDHSDYTAASFAYYKMEKTLQLLKEGYEKVVWIDSDSIATKYIDNIWDKDVEDLNYPLTKRHTYQYLIQRQDGKSYSDAPWMDCESLSGDLMEYLGVEEITLWTSFFSFFLSHKNCISFWEEALDSFQKALKDNVSMPYVLETFVNVMLWKYKASVSISEDLSCIDLDPSLDYSFDLNDLFDNDSKSIDKIEHGNAYFSEWLCVPQNKENILFIHAIKDSKTAEWVLEKYINDIVLKNTINLKLDINKDEKALNWCETAVQLAHMSCGEHGRQWSLFLWEEIFENRTYEKKFEIEENDIVFDIGANVGFFAASCSQRNINRCYCFEPMEENFEHLQKNINNLADSEKFELINKAISTNSEIYIPPEADKFTPYAVEEKEDNHLTLPAIKLSDFLEKNKIEKIDFLKMDIEGGEWVIFNDDKELNVILNKTNKFAAEIHLEVGDHISTGKERRYLPYGLDKTKYITKYLEKFKNSGFEISIESLDGVDITDIILHNYYLSKKEMKAHDYYHQFMFYAWRK